jgi:hypothetical protein
MIETRPRSSAAAWRRTPVICAPSPISHTQLVRSLRNAFPCPGPIPEAIEARCQRVAAKANETAAKIARTAADAFISGLHYGIGAAAFVTWHKADEPVDEEENTDARVP